jgi:hypothetical protein
LNLGEELVIDLDRCSDVKGGSECHNPSIGTKRIHNTIQLVPSSGEAADRTGVLLMSLPAETAAAGGRE